MQMVWQLRGQTAELGTAASGTARQFRQKLSLAIVYRSRKYWLLSWLLLSWLSLRLSWRLN
jgi:hypothetical protein